MKITYDCYPKYEKCLCKLAHKYANRSNFVFDELLSEANQGFIHAVDTYDSSKGACFHTHLYITVTGRLRNYTNKPELFLEEFEDIHQSKSPNPEQATSFKTLLESMGKEAKEVVETVLNTPGEMVDLIRTMTSNRQGKMHLYRSTVTRYFQSKGWSSRRINSAYLEIRTTLWS